jgi:hypothetical protein
VAALLLLFTWTGDAVGLHPCPHHSGVPAADAGHPEGGGHAAHGGHGAHDADPAPHSDDHGACTCAGSCLGGAALPVLDAVPGEAPFAAALARHAAAPDAAGLPDRFPPFVLPYGHAPPALRA